jgi:hypothetical protein
MKDKRLEARLDGLRENPPKRRGIVKNLLRYFSRQYDGPDSKDAPESHACRKEYDSRNTHFTDQVTPEDLKAIGKYLDKRDAAREKYGDSGEY